MANDQTFRQLMAATLAGPINATGQVAAGSSGSSGSSGNSSSAAAALQSNRVPATRRLQAAAEPPPPAAAAASQSAQVLTGVTACSAAGAPLLPAPSSRCPAWSLQQGCWQAGCSCKRWNLQLQLHLRSDHLAGLQDVWACFSMLDIAAVAMEWNTPTLPDALQLNARQLVVLHIAAVHWDGPQV